MGLRKKISLGFVVIGTILLLSSVIAIYELIVMRKTVSALITDNISSINTSRMLLEVTDEYNFSLLKGMGANTSAEIPDFAHDFRFTEYLSSVRKQFTTPLERKYADSVLYAYAAYAHTIKLAPMVWQDNYQGRRNWYFNRLYPIYMQLRGYLQKLSATTQEALVDNSKNLSDSFYRSIMPGVVAVAIGIILVFLFNYFINIYFIRPVISITKGIGSYLSYKKSYSINIETDDELNELNESVKELVDTNKRLTKHFNIH